MLPFLQYGDRREFFDVVRFNQELLFRCFTARVMSKPEALKCHEETIFIYLSNFMGFSFTNPYNQKTHQSVIAYLTALKT